MRPISDMQGLRFPDEFVVKTFFKEKLDAQLGRVLEPDVPMGDVVIRNADVVIRGKAAGDG